MTIEKLHVKIVYKNSRFETFAIGNFGFLKGHQFHFYSSRPRTRARAHTHTHTEREREREREKNRW